MKCFSKKTEYSFTVHQASLRIKQSNWSIPKTFTTDSFSWEKKKGKTFLHSHCPFWGNAWHWLFCLLPQPLTNGLRSLIVNYEITIQQPVMPFHTIPLEIYNQNFISGTAWVWQRPNRKCQCLYIQNPPAFKRRHWLCPLAVKSVLLHFQTAFDEVPHHRSRSWQKDWGLQKEENRMDISVHVMDWMLAKGQMRVWS